MVAETLRRGVRASGALAWTVAAFTLLEAKLLMRPGARELTAERELKRWCRGLLWINGVELRLSGSATAEAGRARLVIANHRSAYDILILFALFGGSLVSRADVADWPLIGHAARRTQTIFVNRESAQSGAQAIRQIRAHLRHGRSVSVFPEGTTSAGDTLLPFAAGALAATRGLDVEIVPVGIAYPTGTEYVEESFLEHIRNVGGRPSLTVGLAIGAPLRPAEGAAKLVRELEAEVVRLIARARALL